MADSDTITDIVTAYTPRLLAFIRSRTDCEEDAEDILQEVFYQLARIDDDERGGIERMSAWLYRVARNAVLNFWRKKRELSLDALYYGDDEACAEISETLFNADGQERTSPERDYLRTLVWQELEDALAELPPAQSEVFCLTVLDCVPVKEIAAATGVPVATVLSRKHYAVKFLRRRFRELYDDLMTQ